jgi:hypothetical protein
MSLIAVVRLTPIRVATPKGDNREGVSIAPTISGVSELCVLSLAGGFNIANIVSGFEVLQCDFLRILLLILE